MAPHFSGGGFKMSQYMPLIFQKFFRKAEIPVPGLCLFYDKFLRYPSGPACQQVNPVGQQYGLVNVVGNKQGGQMDFVHHLQIPVMDGFFGQHIQCGKWLIQQGHAAGKQIRPKQSRPLAHAPDSWAGYFFWVPSRPNCRK